MNAQLVLEDVAVQFGGVKAVRGISTAIGVGEFVGLIGPNGAGKTTLIKIVTGLVRPDRGRIFLEGQDVTGLGTPDRVRRGLALSHQIVRPFREMTALENVALAAGMALTANPWRALFHIRRREQYERAALILAKVGLAGTERKLAGNLPLGQLKRLELARALAVEPRIVFLDEPLAGLNHAEAAKQAETISEINASGVTVVLVEHNLEEVMRICRRLIVLNDGAILVDAEPGEAIANPAVQDAYVGGGAMSHAEA